MRKIVVLLVVLCLGAAAVPAEAGPRSRGARVRTTLEGSGSSTLDGVGGHPVIRSVSEGTVRGKGRLRGATYDLTVSYTGTARYVTLTITTRRGTVQAGAGPMVGETLDAPLTVNSGTGRYAHATGTLTLVDYTKTNVSCVSPYPGVPANIFCTWDETAELKGRIKLH